MKTILKLSFGTMLLCASLLVFQSMVIQNAKAAATTCYQNASKSCISNIAYWYDSCDNIQSVAQNCNTTNQACQNGACVNKAGVNYSTNTTTTNTTNTNTTYNQTVGYIQNYRTNCSNNNIYWYDSRGAKQGVYQNCQDVNTCTLDSCLDNACKTQLKCDGSTCALNSADYIAYCQNNVQGQSITAMSGVGQVDGTIQNKSIVISIFGKKQADGTSWTKNFDATNNDEIEFLMVVKNISANTLNATASADLTNNFVYTGNLVIDGTAAAGSVVSGIDLGSLAANTSKVMQFTGTIQSQNSQAVQVIASTNSNGMFDSDFFTVNITASANTAAVSDSPFVEFIKNWYLWIIIIVVLIALFVIIFRRLSSNP